MRIPGETQKTTAHTICYLSLSIQNKIKRENKGKKKRELHKNPSSSFHISPSFPFHPLTISLNLQRDRTIETREDLLLLKKTWPHHEMSPPSLFIIFHTNLKKIISPHTNFKNHITFSLTILTLSIPLNNIITRKIRSHSSSTSNSLLPELHHRKQSRVSYILSSVLQPSLVW